MAKHRSFGAANVRVGPLAPIPHLLRELGVDPEPVVREAGFELPYFDDPDLPVPYHAAAGLLDRCVEVTGCEYFGLLLGERAGPSSLGLAGFLMMNAPNVGSALDDLVNYLSLHEQGGIATLDSRDGSTLFGFTVIEPDIRATDLICDLSMTVGRNLLRALCGPRWEPSEVLLARVRPSDPAPWKRVFQAPVRFDAGQTALAFPTRWLAKQVTTADPLLHRHLKQQADALRGEVDFPSEVRRLVNGTIAHRASGAPNIAKLLGMHEKTLNRRLLETGATFRQLRDDARYAVARQLLTNSSLNLDEIASSLGYAEASAFIRAFARWSGTTPGKWRMGASRRPLGTAAR